MVTIELEEDVRIPASIADVAAFRRWAASDDFPERGRFDFLRDRIWVDLTMEQAFTHNQVKTRIAALLDNFALTEKLGCYFSDGMRLSHPEVGLSCEPDGLFVAFDTLQKGRLQLSEGREGGCVELVGAPDMVLEVVSTKSKPKDTGVLRGLYWEAGIPEYWLVDARGEAASFDLLRRQAKGYVGTRKKAGWVYSEVFDRSFRLVQEADPLGQPQYRLEMRAS